MITWIESQITGGRVIVGLGIGWFETEFRGYGFPFPEVATRLEQLREAVQRKQEQTKSDEDSED